MGINCSTPLYHDGLVFAASAYGAGGGLVKLSKDANGGIKAEEVYFTSKMQNHHGGMILFDGCLYGANGGNEGGNLICLDFKTGNVMWDGREVARSQTPKGSILLADGRIYYRNRSRHFRPVRLPMSLTLNTEYPPQTASQFSAEFSTRRAEKLR
jgi:outer membrane protein assembly factor BamB